MSSVRLRRLQADYEQIQAYARRHPRLRLIQVQGDPPERYQLEYRIRGLRQVDDQLQVVASHVVEIWLPRDYPRTPPQCRMLTPVFHPNIAPHAICIGDHWSAGEPLSSMVARIGEMLAYQSYNTKSPLNGEAARWVEANQQHLPLDRVSMLLDEPEPKRRPQPAPPRSAPRQPARPQAATPRPAPPQPTVAAPPAAPAEVPAPIAVIEVQCPSCQAKYRMHATGNVKKARCKRCQSIIEIPAGTANRQT